MISPDVAEFAMAVTRLSAYAVVRHCDDPTGTSVWRESIGQLSRQ